MCFVLHHGIELVILVTSLNKMNLKAVNKSDDCAKVGVGVLRESLLHPSSNRALFKFGSKTHTHKYSINTHWFHFIQLSF